MISLQLSTDQPLSSWSAIGTICDKLKIAYLSAGMCKQILNALEAPFPLIASYSIDVEDMKQLLKSLARSMSSDERLSTPSPKSRLLVAGVIRLTASVENSCERSKA